MIKQVLKGTNKWKDILCLWVGRLNIVKMSIPPKIIHRTKATPIQIPMAEFSSWFSGYQTPLGSTRMQVRFLALLSGLRIWRCCELWCRFQTQLGSCIAWLWSRLAAVAPIWPLAWELPDAVGAAPKSQKREKQQQQQQPPMAFLFRKKNPKIYVEPQKTLNSQSNLEKQRTNQEALHQNILQSHN